MGRRRSIKDQLRHAVYSCYKKGAKKRGLKPIWNELNRQLREGEIDIYTHQKEMAKTWCICSRGTKAGKVGHLEGLLGCAKRFGEFVKKVYPMCKLASDIPPEAGQEYINYLASIGWKATTLKREISYLKHLCIACFKTFNTDYNNPKYYFTFGYNLIIPPYAVYKKLRDRLINKEDFEKITSSKYFRDSKSSAKLGVILARHFGLRANEVVRLKYKHIYLSYNEIPNKYKRFVVDKSPYDAYLLIYRSKGGVTRVIPALTREEKELLENIKGLGRFPDDYVVPISEKGVTTFFRRCLRACKLDRYVDKSINIHGLRKLRSSELFLSKVGEYTKQYLEGGNTLIEAIKNAIEDADRYVNRYLGHETSPGDKRPIFRKDVSNVYIHDVVTLADVVEYLVDMDSIEYGPEEIATAISEACRDMGIRFRSE